MFFPRKGNSVVEVRECQCDPGFHGHLTLNTLLNQYEGIQYYHVETCIFYSILCGSIGRDVYYILTCTVEM